MARMASHLSGWHDRLFGGMRRAALALVDMGSVRRSQGGVVRAISREDAAISRIMIFGYDCLALVILVGLALVYYNTMGGYSGTDNLVPPVARGLPIRAMWLGALGGIVASLRGLYTHGPAAWQTTFNVWHIGRPFSGAIAGGITYLLLLAVSGSTPSAPIVMATAFIMGTQERRFLNFLSEVARLVVQVPGEPSEEHLEVKEIRPLEAPSGSTLTILGQGFEPGVVVLLDSQKLQDVVVSRDGTSVTGTVPEGKETARILVYNPTGQAFLGTSMQFTYQANPTPETLDFDPQPVTVASTPKEVTFRNVTAAAAVLTVNVVDVQPAGLPAPWVPSLPNGRVTMLVPANSECKIRVVFTPSQAGVYSGQLAIKGAGKDYMVALKGEGTA